MTYFCQRGYARLGWDAGWLTRVVMAKRRDLNLTEVQSLVRLGKQLHAASDPSTRTMRLLEGLSRLVRARTSSCIVTGVVHRAPRVIARVQSPREEAPQAAPADGETRPISRARRGTHRLRSSLPIGVTGMTATLELSRDQERFTARERALVRVVHKELTGLYETDPLLTSERVRALSPRERQTLECLLAGDSEKQVAMKLRLSHNTVHHYVKALHRHFRVSTRSELLARCFAQFREREETGPSGGLHEN